MGISSVFMSELWALYDGLVLAWNQGFRRLEVVSDNSDIIRSITGRSKFRQANRLFQSIMELINRDWRVTFSHGTREENMLADGLARMADVNIRGLQTLEECLELLKQVFDDDASRVLKIRPIRIPSVD